MVDRPLPDEPAPPANLPAYIVDPVQKQSPRRLRELATWAIDLADVKEAEAKAKLEEAPTPDEATESEVLDQDEVDPTDVEDLDIEGEKVYLYRIKVPCGKDNCSKCPHGPYTYAKWYDGATVRTKYVGKGDGTGE